MEQRLLNKKDAAKYLGISVRTLYYWIERGLVKPIEIPGGNGKFDIQDLDEFIEAQKH